MMKATMSEVACASVYPAVDFTPQQGLGFLGLGGFRVFSWFSRLLGRCLGFRVFRV